MPNPPPTRLQSKMLRAYPLPSLPFRPPTHLTNVCLQNCGHFGHIARVCPNEAIEYPGGSGGGAGGGGGGGGGGGFASRVPPPGRSLNVATLPPVKCYRCGGPNHMARDCLAPPYAVTEDMNGAKPPVKTCYRCKKDGHVRSRVVPRVSSSSG